MLDLRTFLENAKQAGPEAAYLVAAHLGAATEQKLVQSVVNGEMAVEDLTIQNLRRTLELVRASKVIE